MKKTFLISALLMLCTVATHAQTLKANVAQCASRVGGYTKTSVIDADTSTYSPQAGWHIVAYRVYDLGSFGTVSYSFGSNPGAYYAQMQNQIVNTYSGLFQMSASANLPPDFQAALDAYLTVSYNYHMQYLSQFSSSHATIWMHTEARGRGRLVSKGSQIGVGLDTWEIQCLPYCQTPQALDQQLRADVNEIINLLRQIAKRTPQLKYARTQSATKQSLADFERDAKLMWIKLLPIENALVASTQSGLPGSQSRLQALRQIVGESRGPGDPLGGRPVNRPRPVPPTPKPKMSATGGNVGIFTPDDAPEVVANPDILKELLKGAIAAGPDGPPPPSFIRLLPPPVD